MTAWQWNNAKSSFEPTEVTGRLLVADSWFVDKGKSVDITPHRDRFTKSARELGLPVPETDEFWNAIVGLVPDAGEWFPRIEFVDPGDGSYPVLVFRLRVAPARTSEMKLWIPPFSDPRQSPRIKGPDIPLLNDLRTEAKTHDCDDVLLYDTAGNVLETGTSSILFWDGETLCVPDPSLPILPGTTSARMVDRARRMDIPVETRIITVEELRTHEVWITNALHGYRPVVGWV